MTQIKNYQTITPPLIDLYKIFQYFDLRESYLRKEPFTSYYHFLIDKVESRVESEVMRDLASTTGNICEVSRLNSELDKKMNKALQLVKVQRTLKLLHQKFGEKKPIEKIFLNIYYQYTIEKVHFFAKKKNF